MNQSTAIMTDENTTENGNHPEHRIATRATIFRQRAAAQPVPPAMTDENTTENGNHPLLQQGIEAHAAGDLKQAFECYQQLLNEEPESFDALHMLGALAVQVGQLPLATRLLERAIAQNDQVPDAWFHLALAKQMAEDLDGAEKMALQCLQLDFRHQKARKVIEQVQFKKYGL